MFQDRVYDVDEAVISVADTSRIMILGERNRNTLNAWVIDSFKKRYSNEKKREILIYAGDQRI